MAFSPDGKLFASAASDGCRCGRLQPRRQDARLRRRRRHGPPDEGARRLPEFDTHMASVHGHTTVRQKER